LYAWFNEWIALHNELIAQAELNKIIDLSLMPLKKELTCREFMKNELFLKKNTFEEKIT